MTTVLRCFEYNIECDLCGNWEILHTGDSAKGVRVHNIRTAEKVAGFRKRQGKLLCPVCYQTEKEKSEDGYYSY